MAIWIAGTALVIILLAALAVQIAIRHNGPAVLNYVDRITGGARNTTLLRRKQYGDDPAQKLLIYGPQQTGAADTAGRPVLIFVHGGSWNWGDPDDYSFVARAFVPEGFVVVLAGYRLHPKVEYPAMLEDTASAIQWTRQNIAEHGGDPDRIYLSGHSAGAYNVVMAALERRWLAERDENADALAGVIGLAGPYDFYPFDSASTRASFGNAASPETTQPVNHIRGDAPPILLIHGEKDTLVGLRNSRVLARELAAAGGKVETHFYADMDHNQPLIALAHPWRKKRDVVRQIVNFTQ